MDTEKGINKYFPILAGVVTGVCFGLGGYFIKIFYSYTGDDFLKYLTLRYDIALVIMTALVMFGFIKIDFKTKSVKPLLLLSLMCPIISEIFESWGFVHVDISQIAILECIVPAEAVLFSRIFNGEKQQLKPVLFQLLTVFGIIVTQINKIRFGGISFGVILVLIATVSIASQRCMMRRWSSAYTPFEIVYVETVCGAVVFTLSSAGQHIAKGDIGNYFAGFEHPEVWGSILFLGVGVSVIAFLTNSYACKHLPMAISQAMATTMNITEIVAGVALLGEVFTTPDIVGSLIVLCGILGAAFSFKPGSKQNEFILDDKKHLKG